MPRGLLTMNGSSDLAGALAKQMEADVKRAEAEIARAHTAAAKEVAETFKNELRADLAGFSAKLRGSWKARVYRNDGLSPAIYLWNTAPQIVDAFSLGVPIRAANRKFLAVPVGRAREVLKTLRRPSARSRDGAGRFQTEAGTVERVATALAVRLRYRAPRDGKAAQLIVPAAGVRGVEVLFVLVKQVNPPVRMRGRLLFPSLNARVAGEFARALADYV